MPAKVVSFINLKGGVGKSTLAMIIAEYTAFFHHKRVLVIDLDSQANLTYAMVKKENFPSLIRDGKTIYHLFSDSLSGQIPQITDFICPKPFWISNIARGLVQPKLDMMISTPDLAQLDEEMLNMWESNQPAPKKFRFTLKTALKPVLEEYDIIIIDCPPGLSVFTSNAIIASDFFVSPIIPEPLSVLGVDLVKDRIDRLKSHLREINVEINIEFKGCILNKVLHYRNTHAQKAIELYGSQATKYIPFEWWIPDSESLRKVGEYECEDTLKRKIDFIKDKYDPGFTLTNPKKIPSLDRSPVEGIRYRLWERLKQLTRELMDRVGMP